MPHLALALSLLLLLTPAGGAEPGAWWPTGAWPLASPESQGLDGHALAELDREFASGQHGYVDGMLVVRHARLVYETRYSHDYDRAFAEAPERRRGPYNYYDPDWHPYYQRGELHTMQSVTKSVTSALLGIALERGELAGVDLPALSYFEGYRQSEDPRWARITLRHLLTMTAGIRWDEDSIPYTDPANSCARMEQSADWIQFVLDQPMAGEPGAAFVYNSGVSQLLSQVLSKATGRHADEYAAEQLFGPLGIPRFYWKRTPTGHPDTEGGLYLAPRDLARLGLLYARDGVWDGRRLLPRGWARTSTSPLVSVSTQEGRQLGYGYQWWVLPDPARPEAWRFAALGYGGQRLIVVPELDLIAVFTGWNIYERAALSPHLALRRILAAVKPSPQARR